MADQPDPNEFVYIKHADTDALGGPVTREALDTIHAHKGWSEAKPEEAKPEEAKPGSPSISPRTTTTTNQKGA